MRMKSILLAIGIVALLIQGCAAPFSKFYFDQTGGVDITTMPVVLPEGEPRLLRGNREEEVNDSLKMREDGYLLVGNPSFDAGNVDEEGAISQAKRVHAAVVILYSQYTHTESGIRPHSSPNTQTSSTTFSGGTYGSGDEEYFYGNAETTTRGTTTTYIPYNVRKSDYLVTYWIKLKKSTIKLGVLLLDLTTELKQELGSNKGMLIDVVIKDSPAFHADILRGDVLRRIGNIKIYSHQTFDEAIEQYRGKTVGVEIYRNEKTIEKEVKLNAGS